MVEVGDVLNDFELMLAEIRHDLERSLASFAMSGDEHDAELRAIDPAVKRTCVHFETRLTKALERHDTPG
ncbi:hypothetical protein [Methylocystis sp. B8]|uniref:hypothetical protein n=1 Tax=Methylocystis sp. B8 TaxID=544938 RepID=UPI0010FE3B88|nr:hypothetical protein [Methylocystis sp. B8]TLG75161.1 hypothetical protein FEV16_11675 [Methylocystis sp. B8]